MGLLKSNMQSNISHSSLHTNLSNNLLQFFRNFFWHYKEKVYGLDMDLTHNINTGLTFLRMQVPKIQTPEFDIKHIRETPNNNDKLIDINPN